MSSTPSPVVASLNPTPCSAELWEPTLEWAMTDWFRAYCNVQWLECEGECGA